MTYRLLLMEDVEEVGEGLKRILERELPQRLTPPAEVQVDCVRSAEEGYECVGSLLAHGRGYTIAILDAQVFANRALTDLAFDTSVCARVASAWPESLVIHYTGYPGERVIVDHMLAKHQCRPDRAATTLVERTLDLSWIDEVVNRAAEFLRGLEAKAICDSIEARLDMLFGPDTASGGAAGREYGGPSGINVTYELPALRRDLEKHWGILTEPMRLRVREIFGVVDRPNDAVEVHTV